jgi:hypothetical protein
MVSGRRSSLNGVSRRPFAGAASAALLTLCLAACGCSPVVPATAKEFADRYPPIRDPNLVRYILDHRDEIERGIDFDGDKGVIRHVYGQGRDQVIITEYLVKGVPFKIERSRREYGDLLGDLPAEKVDSIAFGWFFMQLPGRFVITDQQEIAEAIRVIRAGTYGLRYDFAYRDMVQPDSAGETIPGEHGPDKRFWGTGCGQGITVILKEGKPRSWEWLGYEARAYHHHDGLLELLDRLTRKHGWVMYEGPHGLARFRPPPEELIPFLSSDGYNRSLALRMLADWGPRASCAIGELEKLQSDPSEKVRRAAAYTLERIRGPSSRPVSNQTHP